MPTKLRTTDRIREDVAFVMDVFDDLGIEPNHISAGGYLSVQVSGYQREDAARAEVDRVALTLGLADDDGESPNYTRRGLVKIAGRQVDLTVYTGRAQS